MNMSLRSDRVGRSQNNFLRGSRYLFSVGSALLFMDDTDDTIFLAAGFGNLGFFVLHYIH